MKHYRFTNTEIIMTDTNNQDVQQYVNLRTRIEHWIKVNPNTFMGPYRSHMYTLDGWLGLLDVCGDLKYPNSGTPSSSWCSIDPLLDIELLVSPAHANHAHIRLFASYADPFLRELRARKLTENHVAHTVYLYLHDCKIAAAKHEYEANHRIEHGNDWARFDMNTTQQSTE
tara:strand:- start:242 stop:754 length:513 start_codon:yes stop_codon:yes gene_type:complete